MLVTVDIGLFCGYADVQIGLLKADTPVILTPGQFSMKPEWFIR